MISFIEMLELSRSMPGVGPAFIEHDGTPRSFDELWSDTHRLGDSLTSAGVTSRSRIALLGTDSYQYMVAMLAALRIGARYFPLNFRLAPSEIQHLLGHCRPDVLFVDDRYAAHAESVVGDALTVSFQSGGRGRTDMSALVSAGREVRTDHRTLDEEVVAVCYTSGTTGQAKGVMQSQRSMKAEFWRHGAFPPAPGDVRYSASPMFHVAGHRMILTHIARGCTSVLASQFDENAVAGMIRRGELDGAFLVPTMLERVLRALGPGDDGSLPLLLYGGSPISPNLLGRVLGRFDSRLFNLFGSTETGMVTMLSAESHVEAHRGATHLLGSIGRAATGVDTRLWDPDGREVADGEVGELVCNTDGAFSGYLDLPQATSEVLQDGWVWTGDLARRDADGYFYYVGRSCDLIVRGGENVYPTEVEDVLTAVPGVVDAAVVGMPHETWGEIVVAFVERRGDGPSVDELVAHCRSRLGSFKIPAQFIMTSSLPRTAAGKVAKNVLRNELAESALPAH